MRIGFRFKLVPFIATVLLVALGIALGNWQERRAAEKIALEHKLALGNAAAPFVLGAAPLDPAANLYRRVAVTGEFVRGWPLYLENRPYQDRVGFYLLMPFKIAGTDMHVRRARYRSTAATIPPAPRGHCPAPSRTAARSVTSSRPVGFVCGAQLTGDQPPRSPVSRDATT